MVLVYRELVGVNGNECATVSWNEIRPLGYTVTDRYLFITPLSGSTNFVGCKVDAYENEELHSNSLGLDGVDGMHYSIQVSLPNNAKYAVVLNIEYSNNTNFVSNHSLCAHPISPPRTPVIVSITPVTTPSSTTLSVVVSIGPNVDYVKLFSIADDSTDNTVFTQTFFKPNNLSIDKWETVPQIFIFDQGVTANRPTHLYAISDNNSGSSAPSNSMAMWVSQKPARPTITKLAVKDANTMTVNFTLVAGTADVERLDEIRLTATNSTTLVRNVRSYTFEGLALSKINGEYTIDVGNLPAEQSYDVYVQSHNQTGYSVLSNSMPQLLTVQAAAPAVEKSGLDILTGAPIVRITAPGNSGTNSITVIDNNDDEVALYTSATGMIPSSAVYNSIKNTTSLVGYHSSIPTNQSGTVRALYEYQGVGNKTFASYMSQPITVWREPQLAVGSIDYEFNPRGLTAVLYNLPSVTNTTILEYGFYFGTSLPVVDVLGSFTFLPQNAYQVSADVLTAIPLGTIYGVVRNLSVYVPETYIYSNIVSIKVDAQTLPPAIINIKVSASGLVTFAQGSKVRTLTPSESAIEELNLEAAVTYLEQRVAYLKATYIGELTAYKVENPLSSIVPTTILNIGIQVTSAQSELSKAKINLAAGPMPQALPAITSLAIKTVGPAGQMIQTAPGLSADLVSFQLNSSQYLHNNLYSLQISTGYADQYSQQGVVNGVSEFFSLSNPASITRGVAIASNKLSATTVFRQQGTPIKSISIVAILQDQSITDSANSMYTTTIDFDYANGLYSVNGVLPSWILEMYIMGDVHLTPSDYNIRIVTDKPIKLLIEFINMSHYSTVGTFVDRQTLITQVGGV